MRADIADAGLQRTQIAVVALSINRRFGRVWITADLAFGQHHRFVLAGVGTHITGVGRTRKLVIAIAVLGATTRALLDGAARTHLVYLAEIVLLRYANTGIGRARIPIVAVGRFGRLQAAIELGFVNTRVAAGADIDRAWIVVAAIRVLLAATGIGRQQAGVRPFITRRVCARIEIQCTVVLAALANLRIAVDLVGLVNALVVLAHVLRGRIPIITFLRSEDARVDRAAVRSGFNLGWLTLFQLHVTLVAHTLIVRAAAVIVGVAAIGPLLGQVGSVTTLESNALVDVAKQPIVTNRIFETARRRLNRRK